MLDPQVQCRVIDVAWEIASKTPRPATSSPEAAVKLVTGLFDQAYKTVLGSVKEGSISGIEEPTRPKPRAKTLAKGAKEAM